MMDRGPMGPTRMEFTKPVVASISGYCVAGGLELALMCDLRVMEESAKTGVLNRRFGVPLIDGGSVRLPELIGLSRALDLIITGRMIEAKEAMQMGLVNRVAKGQLISEGNFGVFKSPKSQHFFLGFLHKPLKWIKSIK